MVGIEIERVGMMAGQTVRVIVKTTAANAKKDVEEAVERAAQGPLKEIMGPFAAPVAAQVGEIIGAKAEEVVAVDYLAGRTLIVYDADLYPDERVLEDKRKIYENTWPDKTVVFVKFPSYFEPTLMDSYYEGWLSRQGKSTDDKATFDRIGIMMHGTRVVDEEDRPTGDPALQRGVNLYPVEPKELFGVVAKYLKPGGDLWLLVCAQYQHRWEEELEKAGCSFDVIVYPGGGEDFLYEDDAAPFIDDVLGL